MRRRLWMLKIALRLVVAWSIGRRQAQGDKATFADPNLAAGPRRGARSRIITHRAL